MPPSPLFLLNCADIFEVRLQPGQLLFAPSGSIHAVRNTGEINFGVSTNYVVRLIGNNMDKISNF
jgi:oxalate decarboxylase/phosphoglucose isomerase-like protein (cupin superfamily)